jgi:hypothetical protein
MRFSQVVSSFDGTEAVRISEDLPLRSIRQRVALTNVACLPQGATGRMPVIRFHEELPDRGARAEARR